MKNRHAKIGDKLILPLIFRPNGASWARAA